MHAPHHAPKEYIDRYKGKFDEGWDVLREKWFDNQKKIGIIPQEAELNPRNECVPAWGSLDDDQKKICARFMEAFAGMLEHTDEQIGRVIDYLEKINQLDNTIIVFLSDNGASPEGGPMGRLNMHNALDIKSVYDTVPEALKKIDLIGSEYTENHYPVGWANLGNTPFQWYKSWVHSGGVKDPMIVHSIESFNPHHIEWTPIEGDIRELYFLPQGEHYWFYHWTKGALLSRFSVPVAEGKNPYTIQTIEGKKYMFLWFKDRDCFFRGALPELLVLEQLDTRLFAREKEPTPTEIRTSGDRGNGIFICRIQIQRLHLQSSATVVVCVYERCRGK